jgi:hypothetical protein
VKITKPGTVTVKPDGSIEVGEDFEFDFTEDSHIAGCRSAALIAAAWAIEQLARELRKTAEKPGGGNICV